MDNPQHKFHCKRNFPLLFESVLCAITIEGYVVAMSVKYIFGEVLDFTLKTACRKFIKTGLLINKSQICFDKT